MNLIVRMIGSAVHILVAAWDSAKAVYDLVVSLSWAALIAAVAAFFLVFVALFKRETEDSRTSPLGRSVRQVKQKLKNSKKIEDTGQTCFRIPPARTARLRLQKQAAIMAALVGIAALGITIDKLSSPIDKPPASENPKPIVADRAPANSPRDKNNDQRTNPEASDAANKLANLPARPPNPEFNKHSPCDLNDASPTDEINDCLAYINRHPNAPGGTGPWFRPRIPLPRARPNFPIDLRPAR